MKNKYFNYLAFIVVIFWILYNLYQGDIYDKEIKNNGIITIGKITKFKAASGSPYLRYQFYINGNSYGSDSRRDKKGEKIGEFYKVIYSSKNPEVNRIYLDEKITDTTAILKAGFTIEEINNKKRPYKNEFF